MLSIFLDNIAVLICLSPMIGMATIALTSHQESETGLSSAFTSGLLTFAFCIVGVAFFQDTPTTETGSASSPPKVQMATSILLMGQAQRETNETQQNARDSDDARSASRLKIVGPNVRVSVGLTGVNQWYALTTAILFFPAVIFCRSNSASLERKQLYALLAFQASAMLVLLAMDLVILIAGLQFMACIYWLMQRPTGTVLAVRDDSQAQGLSLALSSSLILFGAATLASAVIAIRSGPIGMLGSPSFSIPYMTSYLPRKLADDPAAANFWVSMAPWTGISLLIGLLIRCGAFPFQSWFVRQSSPASDNLRIIGGIIIVNSGTYLLLTFVLPFFRAELSVARPLLCLCFSFAAIWTAIGTLGKQDGRLHVLRLASVSMQFSIVGVFSMMDVGQMGAVVNGIATSFALVVVLLDRLKETMVDREHHNHRPSHFYVGILLIGLSPGLLLILLGVSRMDSSAVIWVNLLLVSSIGIVIAGCLNRSEAEITIRAMPSHEPDPSGQFSIALCQAFVAAAILTLILGISNVTSRLGQLLAVTIGIS